MRITRRVAVVTTLVALGVGGLVAPAAASAPRVASAVDDCHRRPGASPLQKVCLSIRSLRRSPMDTFAGWTAADLVSAYAVPPSTSTATVGIVDAYNTPGLDADLAAYRAANGLPVCSAANKCLQIVNQDGKSGWLPPSEPAAYDQGWASETTLDAEMVSAICPACHITVIESNDDDSSGRANMEQAVSTAANKLGLKYISMSWGGPEDPGELSLDPIFSRAGVAYVAAAGDNGYGPEWPAANPNVTAVGGTRLVQSPAASGRKWSETVWNGLSAATAAGATGSGCSDWEPKPGRQSFIPTAVCPRRAIADVSAVADPQNGVAVYFDGSWARFGGTSVAAPIIAAMYAVAGTPTPGSRPVGYLYQPGMHFNDVTSGSNGRCGAATAVLCSARPGWDGPTGLGSPIGVAAFKAPPRSRITVRRPADVTGYAGRQVFVHVAASSDQRLRLGYRVSGLPAGLHIGPYGTIFGTPQRAQSTTVTVTAGDDSGAAASTSFHWTTRLHTLAVTTHVVGAYRIGRTLQVNAAFRLDNYRGAVTHPRVALQWYANGRPIPRATHPRLWLPASLYAKRISVRVTAWQRFAWTYTHRSILQRVWWP